MTPAVRWKTGHDMRCPSPRNARRLGNVHVHRHARFGAHEGAQTQDATPRQDRYHPERNRNGVSALKETIRDRLMRRTVHGLKRGLGAEDIAVEHTISPDSVRRAIGHLRRSNMLSAALATDWRRTAERLSR